MKKSNFWMSLTYLKKLCPQTSKDVGTFNIPCTWYLEY